MKKAAIFLLPFIFSSCIPPATTTRQSAVPRETARQIETQAADVSQARLLDIKALDGYFLRNSVKLDQEVNFFTVNSQKDLEKILGISKTMTNVISLPDFKNAMVAVIAMKPAQTQNDIKITKAYSIGSDVYLEYEITAGTMSDVGYFISNMNAFEIRKPEQVLNVSFVNTDRSMTILPFGRRTAGSPENRDALLKYYTGRYKGTVPAADCPGISMILTLSGDYTYRLEQTYLTAPARTFESAGQWAPSEDLSFFVLDYDKPKKERTAFRFIDRSTVEMFDPDCDTIETSAELYRLRK